MTPIFDVGRIVITAGAIDLFLDRGVDPFSLLYRHWCGDWGDLSTQDKKENDLSVKEGFRILSSYNLGENDKVWIITEADRSATTFLLPEEY